MTEREKMLAGQLYDCGDSELITQWHKAKNLIIKYNTFLDDNKIIIGDNALIAPNVQIYTVFYPINVRERWTRREK